MTTLAFDVYGTLIDTSGVYNTLEKTVGSIAKPFMETWRNKQLEYSFRRGLMNKFVDFSICTKDALEYCCLFFEKNLTHEEKVQLMNAYKVLPAFEDVRPALLDLQQGSYHKFAFSNGSANAIATLLENAKITNLFNGAVSVEDTKMFKPNPVVYKHFNISTNSERSNSWLISGNPFDVMGAISYGMKAVWVQRSESTIFDPWGIEPTAIVSDLRELKSALD